ncbi:HesA/MoeB/ThiF family protein [Mucilaginibacter auburnensis]|uniref:Molybdopterin-synthase adenylyltransferase n=1 Tax=Mucilaginibacter auburnensis TaxID=1457233 RepID=A0A2H9VVW9_9SPHI|nr:HesA/MoeB/ThiF family protein [Mucilaginibacter auburnensis]PJJ84983.1 adenylyltransferase/sulfurtransferase [Mucilaginibacter auburnensis]
MDSDDLRYSCQIALPGFGEDGQQLIKQAKVLIVGAGGLGCPAAQYLVAAGVGTIGIADFDVVSTSNLHRQILYTSADVGKKKVSIAAEKLSQQNPTVQIIAYDVRITSDNVMDTISGYDIVLDGTDNFETRYLLNDACVLTGKPIVYGAIYQYEGQAALWNVNNADGTFSPNYRDLYPKVNAALVPNCADGGVIPTLAGIIGCIQANEVIKYIVRSGDLLVGKVLVFDALALQSRVIKIGNVTQTNIKDIQPTQLTSLMTIAEVKVGLAENKLELVDIRTDQERDVIDIGGFHFEADEFEEYETYLNSPAVKVLYCSSGKRSAEAVKAIKQKWPSAKVFSMEGGLKAWFEFEKHAN